jgi:hypothetical protein
MTGNVSVTFSEYCDARDAIGAAYSALFACRVRQLGRPLFESDWTENMKVIDRLYDRLERLPRRSRRMLATGWPLSDVEVAIGAREIESCTCALFAGAEALEADALVRGDDAALQCAAVASQFAVRLQSKISPAVAIGRDCAQVISQ